MSRILREDPMYAVYLQVILIRVHGSAVQLPNARNRHPRTPRQGYPRKAQKPPESSPISFSPFPHRGDQAKPDAPVPLSGMNS